MSVNKTWNGVTYSIPNTRSESGWETTLSTYLQALADNAATTTFNKQAVRKATTTPVTVSASTDCTIIVDLTGPGASTVNLPAGADKQIFIIVDGKGDASTNNITIDANGSETIEGSLTKVIRLNRECLVLQYSSSAGDWKVIGGYVPNMVGGPASSTDNAIVRFDGTTGKLIQNSDCTISDTGAVTLGPTSGSGLTHILQSGASTNLELLGAGTYSTRLKFNASGGNGMILIPSASSLLFRDNANTTTLGELSAAGAWTLGPTSGSSLTHTIQSGGGTTLLNLTSSAGAYSTQIKFNATGGGNGSILIPSSGAFTFRNNTDTTDFGRIETTGAWTLGPTPGSGTTALTHTVQVDGSATFSIACSSNTASFTLQRFIRGGTTQAAQGVSGSGAGLLIADSAENDYCLYTNTRPYRISTNGGSTSCVLISTAGAVTLGPSSGASTVPHQINAYTSAFTLGNSSLNINNRNGSNAATIALASNGTLNSNWYSSSTFPFAVTNSSLVDLGFCSSAGVWTLGHASSTTGRHEIQNNANSNQTLRVTNAGNSSPNGLAINYSAVDPNNTGAEFLYCTGVATLRTAIRSNGGLANYSANNVNLSDVRVKEGIVPSGSYYEKIKSLEIVRFHYKDQNSKTDEDLNLGVIAQQVLEVMPEVVDEGGFNSRDETKLLAIYDTDLMFASIKALQEAMTKIESLQARIEALENP